MSSRIFGIGLSALAALATPGGLGVARGSGFLLHEHSAEALARGGAVTAGTREPAAVWFNPAALAFASPQGLSATSVFVRSRTQFSPAEGGPDTRSVPGRNLVPSLFGHLRVHDRFTLGAGLYAPFGLAVTWPEGWVGAQHSLRTRLWALAFNPVVAYRLSERWSLAAGLSLFRGGVRFVTDLGPQVGGRADLAGSGWGGGGNVAVLWRTRPDALHLAFAYRSRARIAFRGHANFSPENAVFAEIFADQAAGADVTLPDVLTAAIMLRPRPRLELGFELTQVRWSTFERLEITFERPSTPPVSIDRSTRNPLTARIGVEGWLPETALALRAGFFFDQSASEPATLVPSTPDAHRLGFSAGIGYLLGRAQVDLAYLYAHFLPAEARSPRTGPEAPPKGTYRTRVHAVSLTVTLR
jgi:long-chain fatty acid transport protein